MTLFSSYLLCAMVRCSFFRSFTTGYTGYSKRTWLTWLSWGREIIFSPKHWHMFSIHRWKRMITARTHILKAGWSMWLNTCVCIILTAIHLTVFVSLSKQLIFVVCIEWKTSNLQLQTDDLHVGTTVIYGN